MNQFLLTDCCQCGEPEISLNMCEFPGCDKGICDKCYIQDQFKLCPDCSRVGCRDHFDGMYCHECVKGE